MRKAELKKVYKELEKIQGLTMDSRLKELTFNSGYAVSLTNNRYNDFNGFIQAIETIKLIASEYNIDSYYIGYWNGSDNNYKYLDLSLVLNDLNTSLEIAGNFNQLAVFNFSNFTEIKVKEGD